MIGHACKGACDFGANDRSLEIVKIVIVEDHQLVREMLVMTCTNVLPGASVTGAATGTEGVARARQLQPAVVFLDLVLPDGDGVDFVPQIFVAAPSTRIVALTSHTDEFTLHRALRAHVHGFVDKNEQPLEVLHDAVMTVMDGRTYFSSAAQRLSLAMRNNPASFDKLLSEHEQRILALLGEGLTNDEAAARIGLSSATVRTHRNNIMTKLGIHSTPQLILYAIEKGFTRVRRSGEGA
mgnify:CR=1 FL=1